MGAVVCRITQRLHLGLYHHIRLVLRQAIYLWRPRVNPAPDAITRGDLLRVSWVPCRVTVWTLRLGALWRDELVVYKHMWYDSAPYQGQCEGCTTALGSLNNKPISQVGG
jgi:hypothetical protein